MTSVNSGAGIRNENRQFLGLLGIVSNGRTEKITLDPMFEYLPLLLWADLRIFRYNEIPLSRYRSWQAKKKRNKKIKASGSEKLWSVREKMRK